MPTNKEESEFVLGQQFQPDVFWELHGRQIIMGVVLVVAIGAGLYIWQRTATTRAEQAAEQLAAAQDAPTLENLARQYSGSELGAQALLRLAAVTFSQGRLDDAAKHYDAFRQQYPSHPLLPSARLGLAAVEEARGHLDAARNLYNQLIVSPPNNFASLAARAGFARCSEALGQTNDARRAYEELMAMTQGSPQRVDAYFRYTLLSRDLPRTPSTNSAPAGAQSVPPVVFPTTP